MSTNLSDPANSELAFTEQCKRQASFWVNQLYRRKISRHKVERLLDEMPEKEQQVMRHWLNHYRDMQRKPTKPIVSRGKRELPESWKKQRQKFKRSA